MGHFSKYLPAGSTRVGISNSVVEEKELTAEDVHNGQPLVFLPCSGSELQSWTLDETGMLMVANTAELPLSPQCIDISDYGKGPRLDTYACAHSTNQVWERKLNPECTEDDVNEYGVACR